MSKIDGNDEQEREFVKIIVAHDLQGSEGFRFNSVKRGI